MPPPSLLECFEKVSGGLNGYGVYLGAPLIPVSPSCIGQGAKRLTYRCYRLEACWGSPSADQPQLHRTWFQQARHPVGTCPAAVKGCCVVGGEISVLRQVAVGTYPHSTTWPNLGLGLIILFNREAPGSSSVQVAGSSSSQVAKNGQHLVLEIAPKV